MACSSMRTLPRPRPATHAHFHARDTTGHTISSYKQQSSSYTHVEPSRTARNELQYGYTQIYHSKRRARGGVAGGVAGGVWRG